MGVLANFLINANVTLVPTGTVKLVLSTTSIPYAFSTIALIAAILAVESKEP